MSDPKDGASGARHGPNAEAEEFAARIVQTMGPGEALVMAMRLILLVGQRAPEDPRVVASAAEAVASIKRLGELTATFTLPS